MKILESVLSRNKRECSESSPLPSTTEIFLHRFNSALSVMEGVGDVDDYSHNASLSDEDVLGNNIVQRVLRNKTDEIDCRPPEMTKRFCDNLKIRMDSFRKNKES